MSSSQITSSSSPKNRVDNENFFGELLVSKGLLSRDDLAGALDEQRRTGGRLGKVLLKLGMLKEDDITRTLAEHLSMDYMHFDDISKVDTQVARLLPETICRRFCLIAVGRDGNKIIVAMADPLDVIAIDTITLKLQEQIKAVVSSRDEIEKTLEVIFHGSDVEEQRLRDLVDLEGEDDEKIESTVAVQEQDSDIDSQAAAEKAPVIRFVDLLLSQAAKSRASDIHIEPQEGTMMIRMRVDGILRAMVPPSRKMQAAIVTRIKILSNMNIAERRLPQDGRFKMKASGKDIDVRVSVLPTIYGEKVVMRILDASSTSHDLEKLGFEPEILKDFKAIVKQPYGIIIVTGPTGSGKSTTLYSTLNYLKDPRKNITTVEDPVEYRLAGINQVQVKPDINFDFATCLRAILRQDPDIVLIGEIRDKETVEIAIKASLTGHLVLSTFHTNDAPSAISRLMYMGIEPYLLGSTLNLVIAQRLVRKVCEHCKEPVTLSEEMLGRLKIVPEQAKNAKFYRGKGCPACGGTGYFGRLPIFEFLVVDTKIREALVSGAGESELRSLSRQKGYGGLLESGAKKVLRGLTTAEEVLGTTFAEDIRV